MSVCDLTKFHTRKKSHQTKSHIGGNWPVPFEIHPGYCTQIRPLAAHVHNCCNSPNKIYQIYVMILAGGLTSTSSCIFNFISHPREGRFLANYQEQIFWNRICLFLPFQRPHIKLRFFLKSNRLSVILSVGIPVVRLSVLFPQLTIQSSGFTILVKLTWDVYGSPYYSRIFFLHKLIHFRASRIYGDL